MFHSDLYLDITGAELMALVHDTSNGAFSKQFLGHSSCPTSLDCGCHPYSFYCLAQFTDLLLLESSFKKLSFEDNLIFGQWIQRRKHSIAQKRKSIPPSILHHPLTSSPCLEVLGPWGTFTWTFFSSLLGLNKQFRSYLN